MFYNLAIFLSLASRLFCVIIENMKDEKEQDKTEMESMPSEMDEISRKAVIASCF